MASRNFGIIVPCPVEENNFPPYGTYLYDTCDPNLSGFFTIYQHFADGNGGEYTVDTGISCS